MRNLRKTRVAEITKLSGTNTVKVVLRNRKRHAKYNKIITITKQYLAHCELADVKVGQKVLIMETRPISKLKYWRVVSAVTQGV